MAKQPDPPPAGSLHACVTQLTQRSVIGVGTITSEMLRTILDLVERGADPNEIFNGISPLGAVSEILDHHDSMRWGFMTNAIVGLLFACGARRTRPGSEGFAPMLYEEFSGDKTGQEMDGRSFWIWVSLLDAAYNNHPETFRQLFPECRKPGRLYKGNQLIHISARYDNVLVMQILLESHTDATILNRSGQSPLEIAAANGCTETLRLLLDSGIVPNPVAKPSESTLLELAASSGSAPTVLVLLERGYSLCALRGDVLCSPIQAGRTGKAPKDVIPAIRGFFASRGTIFEASAAGNFQRVGELLAGDPKLVSQTGPEGLAPIHWAALEGQEGVIPLLVAKGADVNGKDSSGRTPLYLAFFRERLPTIRTLLENGADMFKANDSGERPIDKVDKIPPSQLSRFLEPFRGKAGSGRSLVQKFREFFAPWFK